MPISAPSSELIAVLDTLAVATLTTGYQQMEILHAVSVEVRPGELVAIIGPNGSGKSTLLKAICGLLPIWHGSVCLGEHEITHSSPRHRLTLGIGYVPQSKNVFSNMTVTENLYMGSLLAEADHKDQMAAVFEIFPVLKHSRGQIAGRLSGGQQQMLALGRALMARPKVLLLDEPTAGLAPKIVDELFETIRRIAAKGVSALIVEQNAVKALDAADRAYVLANGENQMHGPAQDIARDPAVRRLYLGEVTPAPTAGASS
jgi:ABC-type branched-subunit amino acid transport system ATPase component